MSRPDMPSPRHDFSGKVAAVTGAASGMGRATALAFAAAGASVVLADLDVPGIDALAAQILGQGGIAAAIKVDVASPEDSVAMVALAEARFGRLDFAFNNAGIADSANPPATHDYPIDLWKRMIDIDLSGVFYCLRAELPALLRAGGGAIVNTSSIQFTRSFPRTPAYTAAKHGVAGLTKVICREYAAQRIRCNAVAPGVIRTQLNADILTDPRWQAAIIDPIPAARVGAPEEIANAVLWLCSDASVYVNGICMPVDGGMLA